MNNNALEKGFAVITGEKLCIQEIIKNIFFEESNELIKTLPDTKYVSICFDDLQMLKSKDFAMIGAKYNDCEILFINDCDRYGVNRCYYKPIGDNKGINEYLVLTSGYTAIAGPNTRSWLNILIARKISYLNVVISLKNGGILKYIIDGTLLSDMIDMQEIASLNIEYLSELFSKSVPPRSQAKCRREFLKTVKLPENIQRIEIETWLYRKDLTCDEIKYLSDESITNFAMTYAVESIKRNFDFGLNVLTAKHTVQVIAMKNPENKKYNLETYNVSSKTTQSVIVK